MIHYLICTTKLIGFSSFHHVTEQAMLFVLPPNHRRLILQILNFSCFLFRPNQIFLNSMTTNKLIELQMQPFM